MSTLFTKIKEHYAKQLPFVCYAKPNLDKIIALLQKTDALYELNSDESGFAFVSFDNQQRYIIPENQSDIYFETVSISDFIFPNNREFVIDESAKINFQNLVEKAVSEIEKKAERQISATSAMNCTHKGTVSICHRKSYVQFRQLRRALRESGRSDASKTAESIT